MQKPLLPQNAKLLKLYPILKSIEYMLRRIEKMHSCDEPLVTDAIVFQFKSLFGNSIKCAHCMGILRITAINGLSQMVNGSKKRNEEF